MSQKILKLEGVKNLSKKAKKEINGGHVDGIGTANPNTIWKCYRNDSGNNFFYSSVDLNSPTTVCFAQSNLVTTPVKTQL